MAVLDRVETPPLSGLLLRLLGAAVALLMYLAVQGDLEAGALVAARFGLGILLFALLVDIGRLIAGTSDPITQDLAPHEQRAEPLVDDAYKRVHHAVEAFVDHGRWTAQYADLVRVALQAKNVQEGEITGLVAAAEETASTPQGTRRAPGLAVASGAIVITGIAAMIGVLLAGLGAPVFYPVLAVVGVGAWVLEFRVAKAKSRWGTLGLGLFGAGLVFFAGIQLSTTYGGGWIVLQILSLGLAAGTGLFVAFHAFQGDPWHVVEAELEGEFTTLRRAFLVTLLAGIVLFPFEPLVSALFGAMGWPVETPYRIAVIGFATVAGFLAAELAAAYVTLTRGRVRAKAQRRRRVEVNRRILEVLDTSGRVPRLEGGRLE